MRAYYPVEIIFMDWREFEGFLEIPRGVPHLCLLRPAHRSHHEGGSRFRQSPASRTFSFGLQCGASIAHARAH